MRRLTTRIDTLSARGVLVSMSLAFIAAHTLYFAAGIRFDAFPLVWGWHYLDPALLRARLLESLWYLHSQPPLFNLFLGGMLKVFPGNEGIAFQSVYLGLGFVLYLAVFSICRGLGVSRLIALGVSTALMVSPSFVLYEHWLFYTFPIATILTLSTLLLQRFLSTGKQWYACGLFVTLALLCGMRSLFHIGYYVLIGAALVVKLPQYRRTLLLALIIPGLFVGSLYLKNAVLFGECTASSWFGMSLWKISGRQLPEAQLRQLVAADRLSPLALIDVYSAPEAYPAQYRATRQYAHIPALSQLRKSTGAKNLNHISIVAVSHQYRTDAMYVLRHHPQAFLIGLSGASFGYFKTSSDLEFLAKNKQRIRLMDTIYNYLLYGKVPYNILATGLVPIDSDQPQFFYIFLLIGLPLLVVNGLKLAVWRDAAIRLSSHQRIVIGYVCFNLLYVALIATVFEIGENNRIRFGTDPLYVVLLGVFIQYTLCSQSRSCQR